MPGQVIGDEGRDQKARIFLQDRIEFLDVEICATP
jgi:hypothetical protein